MYTSVVVKKVFTSQNDLLVIRLYIHLWMNRSYINNNTERIQSTLVIVDKYMSTVKMNLYQSRFLFPFERVFIARKF